MRGECTHCVGDESEVFRRNPNVAEAKCDTPMRFALDERQVLDQRLDRCLLCLKKRYVDSVRLEVFGQFNLIDFTSGHNTDACEVVQWLAVGVRRARRVHGQAIAGMQSLKRRLLAVVELDKAALDPALNMLT